MVIALVTDNFAKTAHAVSSIRLADKSILVIDNQVKLTIQGTLGTEQVTTTTPYQLFNAEKVSLEVAGLTVQYAGIENLTTTLTSCRLYQPQIQTKQFLRLYPDKGKSKQ